MTAAQVYVLEIPFLDQDGDSYIAGVFSTRAAAIAEGERLGADKVGRSYWWGTVKSIAQTYDVSEFDLHA